MHATSSRRQILTGSVAALGLAGVTAAVTALADDSDATPSGEPKPQGKPRRHPNLVVIVADDLGSGELGSYGQQLIDTPRMDELAADGLRFTHAYAAAPVCAPSRCSMLTGLHSGHATVRTNPFQGGQASIGDGDTTFAEVLRERGYRTACIGKWGFGPEQANQPSHPNRRGFDEFYGYIGHGRAHDFYPTALWDNGRQTVLRANMHDRRGTYAPELFRKRALEFVSRNAAGDAPFLLYVAPNVPHAPSRRLEPAEYARRLWSKANKGHAVQVSQLDTLVGDIVDRLRAEGLEKDTVVLVTSDNGPHEEGQVDPERFEATGELRGFKRNLYEGGIRVPLVAWAPGRIEPGAVTDRKTPLTDLLPTLAELGGADVPDGIDGLSVAGLMGGGRRPEAHRYLYWFRNDPHTTPRAQAADRGRGLRVCEALRQGEWKIVRFAPGRERTVPDDRWDVELYNLRKDPGERHNVADRHPRIVSGMVALLREAWQDPPPARV
ncbi:Tat pathway signal sequence domain protein [Streptomyces armeniacus]|uniref:Tat pathway signal sequence domain protein n=1 Tax=Streptomyces armeniacus TaxID=83291 RepID=A0A345XI26_9ACTN|nr:arylsulfatase [Streptomyces armeniacus]AXK31292.1 Tat pathway signal sequence domain protein [Streptomyces armeniacus]